MGYIVIAPVGDNPESLFVGMKEFPTEKVILVTPENKEESAAALAEKLKVLTIDVDIVNISGNLLHEMFRVFGVICSNHNIDDLLVNVATGDKRSTCAALSAAYANGIKTFDVMDDNSCVLLPIMKLSYYHELSQNKMLVLKSLKADEYIQLKDLSQKLKMSVSLLSYHINGNYKYKGLKEFRLVDTKEEKNTLLIKLSDMGDLLLKGYIKPK